MYYLTKASHPAAEYDRRQRAATSPVQQALTKEQEPPCMGHRHTPLLSTCSYVSSRR